jgi:outer membrane PBP1 activator LpoA protein
MRSRTPTIAVLALLVLAAVTAGCVTTPPDRAVLNTIEIIRTSSISSMTVIGQMYQAGSISEAQKAEAVVIYNRIQAGCKAVAASASTVMTAQQGTDLTVPLQQLSQQLIALLQQFTTGGKT